jgi:signal transduction histidine kinase
MPAIKHARKLSSLDRLTWALIVTFIFLLFIEIAPKGVQMSSLQMQKDYNELLEMTGNLRSLSQRISFMALGRLVATNEKLQDVLNEGIEKELEKFESQSLLLQEKLAMNSRIPEKTKRTLLHGPFPLADMLDRYIASERIVMKEFHDGFDDMDFLLLLSESTSNVYRGLGSFSARIQKDAESSLDRYIVLQNILLGISIFIVLGTGFFVIISLPRRIRTELLGRYLAESDLRRQVAALEQFSSVVAHDLRGPLNNIHNAATLLTAQGEQSEQSTTLIQIIIEQSERLSSMIRELLNLARTRSEKIRKKRVQLKALLENVRRRLSSHLESVSATINCEQDHRLYVDPTLLENLFQNLFENSLKHSGASQLQIDIRVEPSVDVGKKLCQIIYTDNGKGIDPGLQERVFEPFFQKDANSESGVGLGLAFCRQIAQRHGGDMKAATPSSGKGVEFHIWLPHS